MTGTFLRELISTNQNLKVLDDELGTLLVQLNFVHFADRLIDVSSYWPIIFKKLDSKKVSDNELDAQLLQLSSFHFAEGLN